MGLPRDMGVNMNFGLDGLSGKRDDFTPSHAEASPDPVMDPRPTSLGQPEEVDTR